MNTGSQYLVFMKEAADPLLGVSPSWLVLPCKHTLIIEPTDV